MEFKKFFKSLTLISLLIFIVWSPLFYFNVIVDPYGIFLKLYTHFPTEPNKRYMKIQYLKKHPEKFDSFIFGSSRMNSINPEIIPGGNWYNMTYSLGLPKDHLEDLKYMHDNGIKIKNILIGIDYMALLNNPTNNIKDLLRKKYPVNFNEKIEFYKDYLFNRPTYDFVKLMNIEKDFNRNTLLKNGIINAGGDKIIKQNLEKHIQNPVFKIPSSGYNWDSDIRSNLLPIKEIVEFAKQHDIKLHIFLNPIHFITQLNLNQKNYYDALIQLATITDFYDFGGINSVTLNNANYHETSHFNEKTGNMIINRIFNQSHILNPPDFGEYVQANNIEKHIEHEYASQSSYFEAIDLSIKYEAPLNLLLYKDLGKTSNYHIYKINDFENLSDTLFICSPLIILSGEIFPYDKFSTYYIQIDEKLFEIEQTSTNENQKNESEEPKDYNKINWSTTIPTRLMNDGYHSIRMINVQNNAFLFSEEILIKVIGQDQKYPDLDNLKILATEANLSLDQNRFTDNCYIHPLYNRVLYFSGWASDSCQQSPSGGILAKVNGHIYKSQFIMQRNDLVLRLQNPSLEYAGWAMVIPIEALSEEVNEIEFKVLYPNLNYCFSTRKKITIYKPSKYENNLLQGKTLNNTSTRYSLDAMNGNIVKYNEPTIIQKSTIRISGWAVDFPNAKLASSVVVDIDGNQFMANIGQSRPDVAKALNNSEYINSGWVLEIPISLIGKGEHACNIKIISADGKSYYETDRIAKFIVD